MISNGIHLRIVPPRAKPLDEVLDDVLENGGVQLVDDVLAVPFGQNQLRILEHAQVPGDGRPAGGEFPGDLTGRARPASKELENLAAGRIGEGTENVVHSP